MNKFYINICECGRIHFLDNQKIIDICTDDNSIVHVCGNCGFTTMTWFEDYDSNCKSWCSRSIKDEILDTEKYKIKEIVTTQGEKVPMKTGDFATHFINSKFIDWDTKDESEINQKTVHTQYLINRIRDKDKLRELSYLATNIDWTGTDFENSYM